MGTVEGLRGAGVVRFEDQGRGAHVIVLNLFFLFTAQSSAERIYSPLFPLCPCMMLPSIFYLIWIYRFSRRLVYDVSVGPASHGAFVESHDVLEIDGEKKRVSRFSRLKSYVFYPTLFDEYFTFLANQCPRHFFPPSIFQRSVDRQTELYMERERE